jgi:hypothetical protein
VIRLRPVSMASPFLAAILVVAYRLGLWLIVVSTAALCVVLLRRHVRRQRQWLPALLAARALTPRGRPVAGGVDVITTELVVMSKGRPNVIERATELEHGDPDPNRWATSIDRLTVARHMLDDGSVVGVAHRRNSSWQAAAGWAALAAVALAAGVFTGSRWWLLPITLAYSAATVAWTEWREERHVDPALLAARAGMTEDAYGDDNDAEIAAGLAILAQGRPQPIRRSVGMVGDASLPHDAKARALRLLGMAAALLTKSGMARAATVGDMTTGLVTCVAAAATWWVTGR